jgi:hypothetical protein
LVNVIKELVDVIQEFPSSRDNVPEQTVPGLPTGDTVG